MQNPMNGQQSNLMNSHNLNGNMNGNLNGNLNGSEIQQPKLSLAQRQVHPMQTKINCPQNYYPADKLYQMQNTIYIQKQQMNPQQLNLQQNNSSQPQQQFHPGHRRSQSILYKTPVITQSENV